MNFSFKSKGEIKTFSDKHGGASLLVDMLCKKCENSLRQKENYIQQQLGCAHIKNIRKEINESKKIFYFSYASLIENTTLSKVIIITIYWMILAHGYVK